MDLVYDKAVGSLIGLAIGEAVGTPVHYLPRDSFEPVIDMISGGPLEIEEGGWMDATAMALALADSLISCNGMDEADFLNRLAAWYKEGEYSHTGECLNVSRGTEQAIIRFITNGRVLAQPPKKAKKMHDPIKRLAPMAIFFNYSVPLALEGASRQSKTTHPFPVYLNTCQRMIFELIMLYHNAPIDKLWQGDLIGFPRENISSVGLVEDTHIAAKWALQNTDNFKDAVLLAVNLGNESASVAAVAGQYAGAMYGKEGIPEEWIEKLIWKDYILETVEKLYYEED